MAKTVVLNLLYTLDLFLWCLLVDLVSTITKQVFQIQMSFLQKKITSDIENPSYTLKSNIFFCRQELLCRQTFAICALQEKNRLLFYVGEHG